MRQHNLAPLVAGIEQGRTDFQGRETPAAVVDDGLALEQARGHLNCREDAHQPLAGGDHLTPASVAVDVDAVGRLSHVTAFAAGDGDPEPAEPARRQLPNAEADLRLLLLARCAGAERVTDGRAFGVGIHARAVTPGQLRGVEIPITVVGYRRRRPVLKLEVCREVAGARPVVHPASDVAAYAA